jgi:hypothetical protein
MGGEELVDEVGDFLQRQLGRGVRVEHGGVAGVVAAAGDDRLDSQFLDVDVGLHDCRKLGRQPADPGRLDAIVVDQASPRSLSRATVPGMADHARIVSPTAWPQHAGFSYA